MSSSPKKNVPSPKKKTPLHLREPGKCYCAENSLPDASDDEENSRRISKLHDDNDECDEEKQKAFGIKMIDDFNRAYENRLQYIDRETGVDCVELKYPIYKDWVRDLTDQVKTFVTAFDELEREAKNRFQLLENKLKNDTAALGGDSCYKKMQNDLKNLLTLIHRALEEGKWNREGLEFMLITWEDIFGKYLRKVAPNEQIPLVASLNFHAVDEKDLEKVRGTLSAACSKPVDSETLACIKQLKTELMRVNNELRKKDCVIDDYNDKIRHLQLELNPNFCETITSARCDIDLDDKFKSYIDELKGIIKDKDVKNTMLYQENEALKQELGKNIQCEKNFFDDDSISTEPSAALSNHIQYNCSEAELGVVKKCCIVCECGLVDSNDNLTACAQLNHEIEELIAQVRARESHISNQNSIICSFQKKLDDSRLQMKLITCERDQFCSKLCVIEEELEQLKCELINFPITDTNDVGCPPIEDICCPTTDDNNNIERNLSVIHRLKPLLNCMREKIVQLNQENFTLKKKFKETKACYCTSQNDLKELQAELQDVTKRYCAAQDEIKKMRKEMTVNGSCTEGEVKDMKRELQQVRECYCNAQNQVRELKLELERLRECYCDCKKQDQRGQMDAQFELNDLKCELQQAQTCYCDAQKQVKQLKCELQQAQACYSDSQNQVVELKCELQRVRDQGRNDGDAKNQVKELKCELQHVRECYCESQKEVKDLKCEVQRIRECYCDDKKQSRCDSDAQKQIADLKCELEEVCELYRDAQKQVKELKCELQRVLEFYCDDKKPGQSDVDGQKQVHDLKCELQDVRECYCDAQKQVKDLKCELQRIRERYCDEKKQGRSEVCAQKQVNELKCELQEARECCCDAQKQYKELKYELQKAEACYCEAETELKEVKYELKQSQTCYCDAQLQVKELKYELQQLRERICDEKRQSQLSSEVQNQVKDLKCQLQEVHDLYCEAQREVENLKCQLQEACKSYCDEQKNVKELKCELQQAQACYCDAQKQIKELQCESTACDGQIDEICKLKCDLLRLRKEIAKLRSEKGPDKGIVCDFNREMTKKRDSCDTMYFDAIDQCDYIEKLNKQKTLWAEHFKTFFKEFLCNLGVTVDDCDLDRLVHNDRRCIDKLVCAIRVALQHKCDETVSCSDVNTIETAVSQLREVLNAKESEIFDLKCKLSAVSKDSESMGQMSSSSDECAILSEQASLYFDDNMKMEKQVELMHDENLDLKRQLYDLESDYASLKERLPEDSIAVSNRREKSIYKLLKKDLDQLKKQSNTIQTSICSRESELKKLKYFRDKCLEMEINARQELDMQKSHYTKIINELHEELASLSDQLAEQQKESIKLNDTSALECSISEIENQNDILQKTLCSYENRLAESENRNKTLCAERAKFKCEIDNLKRDLNDKSCCIRELKIEIDQLKIRLSDVCAPVDDGCDTPRSFDIIKQLNCELKRVKKCALEEKTCLSREIDEHCTQIGQLKNKICSLENVLAKREQEVDCLNEKILKSDKRARKMEEELYSKTTRVTHLEREDCKLRECINQLSQQLSENKKEMACNDKHLLSEVSCMKLKLEEQKKMIKGLKLQCEMSQSDLNKLKLVEATVNKENTKLNRENWELKERLAGFDGRDGAIAKVLCEVQKDLQKEKDEVNRLKRIERDLCKICEQKDKINQHNVELTKKLQCAECDYEKLRVEYKKLLDVKEQALAALKTAREWQKENCEREKLIKLKLQKNAEHIQMLIKDRKTLCSKLNQMHRDGIVLRNEIDCLKGKLHKCCCNRRKMYTDTESTQSSQIPKPDRYSSDPECNDDNDRILKTIKHTTRKIYRTRQFWQNGMKDACEES